MYLSFGNETTLFFVEPIKIDKQPKSQKQKEGSRVEFKFKVQGHDRLLYMYQWFKDGVDVLKQNNATLVLECIELRDFGCYTCQVSYQDGYGEIVSSGAVLDVIPQCRNGMSKYCLHIFSVKMDS